MARGDKNNGNGDNGDQSDTNANAEQNTVSDKNVGSETQVQDEARNRDTQERQSDVDRMEADGRSTDAFGVPGAERSLVQPQPGVHPHFRTDYHSPMPEGDTASHNAGNASPAYGEFDSSGVQTQFANQRTMGMIPDGQPSPWPIAPKPVDAGLVSPSGISARPAHHEAAVSHLTMRLGEMRNFLAGFAHEVILQDVPELQGLVSNLKHALGLPQSPHDVAAARVGYHMPVGPGAGSVAQAGRVSRPGPISTTAAGSYAQGSYGPTGVQENNQ